MEELREKCKKHISDPEYCDTLLKHTYTLNPKKDAAKESFEEVRDQLFLKSLRKMQGV